ncbi:DUF3761 domain-containing protein [Luteibacter sp. dw_328]|uniref:DUF3761 domain-containing protein n=1 Tax=Luteibacter sp. dw_328 TaxID=2719796 RepID=UPI0031F30FF0
MPPAIYVGNCLLSFRPISRLRYAFPAVPLKKHRMPPTGIAGRRRVASIMEFSAMTLEATNRIVAIILAALLFASPVVARQAPSAAQRDQSTQSAPATLVEGGYYTNHDGASIHRPAHTTDNQVPPGASAQCRDGSFSFSASRRGTCSRHGGVAAWL